MQTYTAGCCICLHAYTTTSCNNRQTYIAGCCVGLHADLYSWLLYLLTCRPIQMVVVFAYMQTYAAGCSICLHADLNSRLLYRLTRRPFGLLSPAERRRRWTWWRWSCRRWAWRPWPWWRWGGPGDSPSASTFSRTCRPGWWGGRRPRTCLPSPGSATAAPRPPCCTPGSTGGRRQKERWIETGGRADGWTDWWTDGWDGRKMGGQALDWKKHSSTKIDKLFRFSSHFSSFFAVVV